MAFDDDARVEELKLLSEIDKNGLQYSVHDKDYRVVAMVLHLHKEGFFNGIDTAYVGLDENPYPNGIEGPSLPERRYLRQKWEEYMRLYGKQQVLLRLSHQGRLRLAELRQTLAAERQKEAFGILLDGRYRFRDIELQLARATLETPLCLAFLDMNGLKAINDKYGHAPGDEAIKTFLRTVALIIDGKGDGYRIGGDEVLVVLPKMKIEAAAEHMLEILRKISKESIHVDKEDVTLSASCGLVALLDPNETPATAIDRADKVMYRAKERSKQMNPGEKRPSVLAVENFQPVVVTKQ